MSVFYCYAPRLHRQWLQVWIDKHIVIFKEWYNVIDGCYAVIFYNSKFCRKQHLLHNTVHDSVTLHVCTHLCRSVKKRTQSLELSCKSTCWILHCNLHYNLFKLAITSSLKSSDHHTLKSFAETWLDKTDNNRFNVKNLTISDEACFHITRVVNKQNCRYWAPSGDNPCIIHEKPLHDLHVTAWIVVAAWGIVKIFFLMISTWSGMWTWL